MRAIVVSGGSQALLGRNWMAVMEMKIDVNEEMVSTVKEAPSLEALLNKYAQLFEKDGSKFKGPRLKLQLKAGETPAFHKPRPVPYATVDAATAALQKMQDEGIISPVRFSDAACPPLYVQKTHGTLRVCADLRTTANRVTDLERYPLPRPDNLFAALDFGKAAVFSKLDLVEAFHQMEMHEDSKWSPKIG